MIGNKTQLVGKTSKFPHFEIKYTSNYSSYGGRTSRTFINGIGVASIDGSGFRFGSDIYKARALTHPIHLAGSRGARELSPRINIDFYVEDRDGYSHLNLARTQITKTDDELTEIMDEHLYALLWEELRGWDQSVRTNNQWALPTKTFRIHHETLFLLNGHFFPLDRHMARTLGVKAVVRIYVEPKEAIELSLNFPRVAIVVGKPGDAIGDILNIMRDRRQVSYKDSMFMLVPTTWADKLRASRQLANWMADELNSSRTLQHAGSSKLVLQSGSSTLEQNELVQGLLNTAKSEFVEAYFSASAHFDWSRWNGGNKEEESVFSSYWDKFGSP